MLIPPFKKKTLVPHSKEWRELRRAEMQRTRKIRGTGVYLKDGQRKIRDWYGDERLAPGKDPDPDPERCLCPVTANITERERKL
jgi:hypothetical protein